MTIYFHCQIKAQDSKEGYKPGAAQLADMINQANPSIDGNTVLFEEDFIAMMVMFPTRVLINGVYFMLKFFFGRPLTSGSGML